VAFSTLSFGQLLYALACRSDERSGLRRLGDNSTLAAGLGGMLALQAATVLVPPLRALLRTTPLDLADVALISAGATVPLLVREALKTTKPDEQTQGGRHG
jgi:magnesium-transporting ATPase (P-type)